jgi:hypothetical protein
MEYLPKKPEDELDISLEDQYPGLDSMLSDVANDCRSMVPKKQSNKALMTRMVTESFELLGGVPRFTVWADQNYGEYVKLLGKLAPAFAHVAAATVQPKIISAIPPSPLDGDWEEGEFTEKKADEET